MTFMEIGEVISGPIEDLIHWMQARHLLASSRDWPSCNVAMVLSIRNDISDGYRYIKYLVKYLVKDQMN